MSLKRPAAEGAETTDTSHKARRMSSEGLARCPKAEAAAAAAPRAVLSNPDLFAHIQSFGDGGFWGPNTYRNLRLASKTILANLRLPPYAEIFAKHKYLYTPRGLDGHLEVTYVSAQYAFDGVCAFCRQRSRSHDDMKYDSHYSIYCHKQCLINNRFIFRISMTNRNYEVLGQYNYETRRTMAKGLGMFLFGFKSSGGLIPPRLAKDCVAPLITGHRAVEHAAAISHAHTFSFNEKQACVLRFMRTQSLPRLPHISRIGGNEISFTLEPWLDKILRDRSIANPVRICCQLIKYLVACVEQLNHELSEIYLMQFFPRLFQRTLGNNWMIFWAETNADSVRRRYASPRYVFSWTEVITICQADFDLQQAVEKITASPLHEIPRVALRFDSELYRARLKSGVFKMNCVGWSEHLSGLTYRAFRIYAPSTTRCQFLYTSIPRNRLAEWAENNSDIRRAAMNVNDPWSRKFADQVAENVLQATSLAIKYLTSPEMTCRDSKLNCNNRVILQSLYKEFVFTKQYPIDLEKVRADLEIISKLFRDIPARDVWSALGTGRYVAPEFDHRPIPDGSRSEASDTGDSHSNGNSEDEVTNTGTDHNVTGRRERKNACKFRPRPRRLGDAKDLAACAERIMLRRDECHCGEDNSASCSKRLCFRCCRDPECPGTDWHRRQLTLSKLRQAPGAPRRTRTGVLMRSLYHI